VPSRQAGSFVETAHRAVSIRSALFIAGSLAHIMKSGSKTINMKEKSKPILCLLLAIFCYGILSAQEKNSPTPVCLNHICIVLDSVTYHHFFNSPFMTDTLGDYEVDSTTTTSQSYFGNYLFGKEGYLERLSTNAYKNASLGDIGLGFITFRTGDIWRIRDEWQRHSADSIRTDTGFFDNKGTKESWYYSIWLSNKDFVMQISIWLQEHTPEHMKLVGFSEAEMKHEITWGTYIQKQWGKKFTKLFDRITAVHLSLNNDEFEYLRKTLIGFGLIQLGTTFSNQYLNVTCDIIPHPTIRIQTITLALNESVDYRRLTISEHLILELEGKIAVFKFE
jgi:hypothetical protein